MPDRHIEFQQLTQMVKDAESKGGDAYLVIYQPGPLGPVLTTQWAGVGLTALSWANVIMQQVEPMFRRAILEARRQEREKAKTAENPGPSESSPSASLPSNNPEVLI